MTSKHDSRGLDGVFLRKVPGNYKTIIRFNNLFKQFSETSQKICNLNIWVSGLRKMEKRGEKEADVYLTKIGCRSFD